ncbi:MAG: hypothetical protein D6696_21295 [Acidobacteria bacterium]|nr:MAG: hypothetical protein D6696_21295 [Acidobacteriota bacterium]
MMRRTIRFLLLALILLTAEVTLQAEPLLVRDVNQTIAVQDGSPRSFHRFGDHLAVFVAGPRETQLWRTDGTAEGTYPIVPLPATPSGVETVEGGGKLFFRSRQGGLWCTDGTVEGTVLLSSSNVEDHLFYDGQLGLLFFYTFGQVRSSDGTREGTRVVIDGVRGYDQVDVARVGDRLAIVPNSFNRGRFGQLWLSDGSTEGSVTVPSLWHVRSPPLSFGSKALFVGAGFTSLYPQLWRTDGTLEGTVPLALPGDKWSFLSPLVEIGGKAVFVADDGVHGPELWRSDGTVAGTKRLTAFTSELGPVELQGYWLEMTRIGDLVYFAADDGISGFELWRTDGTVDGTRQVFDLCPGPCDSGFRADPDFIVPFGERLIVSANDLMRGREVWAIEDGEATLIADTCPGECSGALAPFRRLGDAIVYSAFFGLDEGYKLMRLDGTPEGTTPITDGSLLEVTTYSSIVLGDRLLFAGRDALYGWELWSTDGTSEGTALLRNLTPETNVSANPHDLVALGEAVFFSADDGVHGRELWRSGGGSATTTMVRDIEPGEDDSSIGPLLRAGDRLYFEAQTAADGTQLWTSDGSASGTLRLTAFDSAFDLYRSVIPVGERLFFAHAALWVSDGTVEGTLRLTPDGTHVKGRLLSSTPGGDHVLFAGEFEDHSHSSLWSTDGTVEGTRPLLEGMIHEPTEIVAAGDRSYVVRRSRFSHSELWSTDGTDEGTVQLLAGDIPLEQLTATDRGLLLVTTDALGSDLLMRVEPGTEALTTLYRSSDYQAGIELGPITGDHLYFTATNSQTTELWTFDENARQARELLRLSAPIEMLDAGGGGLYFIVPDGDAAALWHSDGSPEGTRVVIDSLPSSIAFHQLVGDEGQRLLIAADDGDLWGADGPTGTAELLVPALDRIKPVQEVGGVALFSACDDAHGCELWRSDGTAEGTRVYDLEPGSGDSRPSAGVLAGERLYFVATTTAYGRELWSMPAGDVLSTGGTSLALGEGDRFTVRVDWRKPGGEERGAGTPVGLTADTGYFWFFRPSNVEVMIKVLDGRRSNGHFWVFFAGLSNLEYTITVVDRVSGAIRSYHNPAGRFASAGDVTALPDLAHQGAAGRRRWRRTIPPHRDANPPAIRESARVSHRDETGERAPSAAAGCSPSPTALCLQDGRFRVEVEWRRPDGTAGPGEAMPLTADTGYFWFFRPGNAELLVKVLDGRRSNGHFWVFFAGLTNLDLTLTITDTATGAVRRYHNPRGSFPSAGDTTAF